MVQLMWITDLAPIVLFPQSRSQYPTWRLQDLKSPFWRSWLSLPEADIQPLWYLFPSSELWSWVPPWDWNKKEKRFRIQISLRGRRLAYQQGSKAWCGENAEWTKKVSGHLMGSLSIFSWNSGICKANRMGECQDMEDSTDGTLLLLFLTFL